jgi:hypothetical protein
LAEADKSLLRNLAERIGGPIEQIEIVRSGKYGVEVVAPRQDDPTGTRTGDKKRSSKKVRSFDISDEEIILICKEALLDFIHVDDNPTPSNNLIDCLQHIPLGMTKNEPK